MRRPNWENVSYPADSHIVTSGHWNISADSTSSEFIVLNDSTVVPHTVPYSAIEKSRLL
uniref:Uncharacterized protein n=1 Tax=Globodera pallida TaxID=36090 RepID=A0A183CS23_GLOPA